MVLPLELVAWREAGLAVTCHLHGRTVLALTLMPPSDVPHVRVAEDVEASVAITADATARRELACEVAACARIGMVVDAVRFPMIENLERTATEEARCARMAAVAEGVDEEGWRRAYVVVDTELVGILARAVLASPTSSLDAAKIVELLGPAATTWTAWEMGPETPA